MLFKQNRFSFVTGGKHARGIWGALCFSGPAEKFSWLLLPRFHKQQFDCSILSIIDENYFCYLEKPLFDNDADADVLHAVM